METPKSYQLTVTLRPTPITYPNARKARLIKELPLVQKIQVDGKDLEGTGHGLRLVKYSGEVHSVEKKHLSLEDIANEVLRLVSPARRLTKEESENLFSSPHEGSFRNAGLGWLVLEDLETEDILQLINEFGMVGLANYNRRDAIRHIRDPEEFISAFRINKRYLESLKAEIAKDPTWIPKKISKIIAGEEIPLNWIEEDIRILAKCIRMIHAIDQGKEEWWHTGKISLSNAKNSRRMIHAWEPFTEIPDYKDSGNFLTTDPRWYKYDLEALLQDFISRMNRFLLPLSRNAILTNKTSEIKDANFGLETSLIAYLFLNKNGRLLQIQCENPRCGRLVYQERITRRFCGDTCATNNRVREYRARQKVSATNAGSKKPTNRKEKKNEPTQSGRTKGRNR